MNVFSTSLIKYYFRSYFEKADCTYIHIRARVLQIALKIYMNNYITLYHSKELTAQCELL
jgi:hypothetical protein